MNANSRCRRHGVTLLELVMVITLMGILAAIGTAHFGRSVYANFGSQGEARTLALSMLRAQRAAITTGDLHRILLDSNTNATQYSVQRQQGDAWTDVEGPCPLNKDVTITSTHTAMQFNFEGEALAAYQLDFIGNGRNWRLNVVPITGALVVTDVTP